ncbi:MAG: glycosyltransferase [Desulfovibrio sp.]|nr:glycosyltransferase [Desulfovibrio sp.]
MRFPNSSAHAIHCALTAANFAAAGAETIFFPGIPFSFSFLGGPGRGIPDAFFAGLGFSRLPARLRLEIIGTGHKGLYGQMFRRRLKQVADEQGGAVCFASSVKEAALALDVRKRSRNKDLRVVFEIHHLISLLKKDAEAEKLHALEKRAFAEADLIVFNCEALKQSCQGYLPQCVNSLVSPLGYNEKTIRAARDPVSNPEAPEPAQMLGVVNLAYVGSLQEGKGLENLLQALALLGDNFALTLIGGRPEKGLAALKKLAARLGVEGRVNFTGLLAQTEIGPHLADCDIFVIPMDTDKDFFAPLKMYEALGFALPIVATPMPSLLQGLTREVNARFADGCSPAHLAQSVKSLAADPDLRRRMRRNNFLAAKELSSSARAEKLLDYFHAAWA